METKRLGLALQLVTIALLAVIAFQLAGLGSELRTVHQQVNEIDAYTYEICLSLPNPYVPSTNKGLFMPCPYVPLP